MQDDVDDRRGRYLEPRPSDARYEEPVEEEITYEDEAPYQHDPAYDDFDDPAGYDEPPPRRSRLVPVLTIVAGVLVVAIAVVGVLYALGVFDSNNGPTTATSGQTPIDLTPDNVPEAPEVRAVGVNQTPGDLAADSMVPDSMTPGAAPDVRDAAVSIAPPAQGEPPVRSTHGDWQVRCDTPAGAQGEQCVLMQFVTAEDRDNVGLTVIVLKTADGAARIMRILAPLGVLLPSGLGLKIDEADIGRAGFVRCLPNGCVAEVILEEELLGQLNKGGTATFIIFQTPEEGIGIPISLAGFNAGFASLP